LIRKKGLEGDSVCFVPKVQREASRKRVGREQLRKVQKATGNGGSKGTHVVAGMSSFFFSKDGLTMRKKKRNNLPRKKGKKKEKLRRIVTVARCRGKLSGTFQGIKV